MGRGLMAVITTTVTSGMTHHHHKVVIEEACLKEAHLQFTQANGTPFMVKPLITNLHWLWMHLPQFDNITNRECANHLAAQQGQLN